MLIIQASDKIGVCEVDTVLNLGRAFGMSVHVEDVRNLSSLFDAVDLHVPQSFDVIYLCGHANETHFGGDGSESDRKVAVAWPLVSAAICELLRENSLVFLAACKGGLDQVAYDLYLGCESLDVVVGPAANVDGDSLLLAFHVMLYQRIVSKVTEQTAALAAELASRKAIRCWDGEDVRSSLVFQSYALSGFDEKYREVRNNLSVEDQEVAAAIFDDWKLVFEAA